MISSQPPPDPARTSYVPTLRLSAVGGATVTATLFVSSSRVNARLSAGIGGPPAGGGTAGPAQAGPRARLGTVPVEGPGSRAPPAGGHRRSTRANGQPPS